ncbi:DUF2383 domain-containing protein [Henriciella litoralis]|uniref:DUF2383 domain-containing protein n=1 Tax=Henriciella litoralis TaxID=568102 RepID=UPI000A05A7C5|nr:DUF2383 domain-containing protein [Henriciella litoralis]
MKTTLLATVALALPLTFSACSSAGLSGPEAAMAEQNEAMAKQNIELPEATQTEIVELNDLTRVYIDAAALYKQAADLPDQQNGLKPALLELAKERNMQREKLQERVLMLGGEPAEMGEALGTAHRSFTSLRTLVDNDSEVAVAEVLRGERYIRDEIDELSGTPMTAETAALLTSLRAEAAENIKMLQDLKMAT